MVIGGLVAFALILGLAGLWMARQPISQAGVEEEAIRFLEQIRNREIDQAWQETTAEFKSFVGRDRLVKTVRSNPALQDPCELVSCQPADIGPLNLVECLFRSPNYADVTVRVLMAPTREGQWKVERLEVQKP